MFDEEFCVAYKLQITFKKKFKPRHWQFILHRVEMYIVIKSPRMELDNPVFESLLYNLVGIYPRIKLSVGGFQLFSYKMWITKSPDSIQFMWVLSDIVYKNNLSTVCDTCLISITCWYYILYCGNEQKWKSHGKS